MDSDLPDLEKIVDLIDEALVSTDPRVLSSLRQLLTVVILTTSAENQDLHQVGPLRAMQQDIANLRLQIASLQHQLSALQNAGYTPTNPYPGSPYTYPGNPSQPTWITSPSTGTPWVNPSYTTTGTGLATGGGNPSFNSGGLSGTVNTSLPTTGLGVITPSNYDPHDC